MVAIIGLGVVAGVAQPVDPRVIAAEPLTDRERAVGWWPRRRSGRLDWPGSCSGWASLPARWPASPTAPVVVLAVTSWLLALLLVARTATNLLAVLVSRFPRAGQLVVGMCGLVFYGMFQFVPSLMSGLSDDQRSTLARVAGWTPPGQIGRALASSGTSFPSSILHLGLGTIWLPVLWLGFAWSADRLAVTVRSGGGLATADTGESGIGRLVRRACGTGPIGSIAWRSLLVRFRTPRTALETVTGAGVGLAAVLVPTLLRDNPGSGAVLVGGAVQLAVLFMSGNSFGSDGPALTHELLAGADPATLVGGKARSILIVASPLAVIGPLLAAAITTEWRYLLAGLCVGAAGLMAGTGAATVQSAMVPIAIPESDNPFAGGESGKGMIAGLLLLVVVGGLAIATVPAALALFWATERGRAGFVTVLAALIVVVGWGVMRFGIGIATSRLSGRDPEFVTSVTPTR